MSGTSGSEIQENCDKTVRVRCEYKKLEEGLRREEYLFVPPVTVSL